MLLLYINGVERTNDLERSSISRNNQIQQRSDSLDFNIFRGTKPSENQDVKFYIADEISSIVGDTVTLKGYFEKNTNKFREGQKLFIRVGEADMEKVTVSSVTYLNNEEYQLILENAPTVTVNPGDYIGELWFGGVVSRVKDYNVGYLDNLEYSVECVEYVKIFDKKLVSDTWQNVDSRYIINDFVNTTVNYNSTLDNLSYTNNTNIQSEWNESGTGGNPTVDISDCMEGSSSGVFSWTSSGTAVFEASPVSRDLQLLTGVASGMPTKGFVMLWVKPDDITTITAIKLRLGSDSSNYLEINLGAPTTDDEWQYISSKLKNGTLIGTPNWTATDYIALVIDHTGSSSMKVNGFRVNADGSFTLYNVTSTPNFVDLRSPQLKPTSLMQLLAKNFQYIWYIDYEQDIVFKSAGVIPAPFAFTDTSNNFRDLEIEVDQSQIGNRVIVRGGEKTSASRYAEVKQGTNGQREWLLKSKFNGLEVTIDDNTSTHSAEVGTNTTTIKITGHGLSSGDHVINRTRNAVREVEVVDPDTLTVETVSGQTNGDTISFFSVVALTGIEGIADEATVDYVFNSNEKSVRASDSTGTLPTTAFIRFEYNERVPIQIEYIDSTSVNALKAHGFGDGIFDLDPITDRNITDSNTAYALAQAKVSDYRNPIVTGRVKTDQDGLKAGQVLTIQDSHRGITASYVIQTIRSKQKEGEFSDYFTHDITFGTTLFGIIEFYQKLLRQKDAIEIGTEEEVDTFATANEDITCDDTNALALGGFKRTSESEDIITDDSNLAVTHNGIWQFEPSVGQPLPTRFDLASFS